MGYNFICRLRLDTAARKGKTVSVIDHLPPSQNFLEPLARELKMRCGSGGTYRIGSTGGLIEIQGDKRELIRRILAEKEIPVKEQI